MNPQDNNSGEQGNNTPNFDGFGGPNISYENYKEAPVQAAPAPVQPAINVVNANGVISGRKMVDYLWQRIAYCGLAFSAVLLIGLIITVVLVGNANTERVKMETAKTFTDHNIQGLYEILGVNSQEDAVKALSTERELLNGGDLLKIDKLLTNKYGAGYVIDFADSNLNFVRVNDVFKVASFGLVRPTGTIRIIVYGRIASGEWKLGGFDSTNTVDPCANSSEEEKEAIEGIFTCGEPVEEDDKSGGSSSSDKKSDDSKKDEGDEDKTKTEE